MLVIGRKRRDRRASVERDMHPAREGVDEIDNLPRACTVRHGVTDGLNRSVFPSIGELPGS